MMKKDFIREFDFEHNRCQGYFDWLYRILQFTFAAVVVVITIFFKSNVDTNYFWLIFQYILPVCLYVLGIMYAYNAYALAIYGKRAETIHEKIYEKIEIPNDINNETHNLMRKYVCTNRLVTLLSYGVPLAFYILIPFFSCLFGCQYKMNVSEMNFVYKDKWFNKMWNIIFDSSFGDILPWILYAIYFLLLIVVIINIGLDHFAVNSIQEKNDKKGKYNL